MNHRQYREWQKEQLLRQIQQQRLDLAASKTLWLEKTAPIDHGWQVVYGLRKYIAIGSTIFTFYSLRHPNKLMRWSRRTLSLWGTFRLMRKSYQALRVKD